MSTVIERAMKMRERLPLMVKPKKQPKYHNKKVVVDGIKFDSKREANRYQELKILERAGKISDLRLQVPFELIPSQRVDGKVVERSWVYVADFVYTQDGNQVIEDSKGMVTREYVAKRKAMLFFHNIRIKEV